METRMAWLLMAMTSVMMLTFSSTVRHITFKCVALNGTVQVDAMKQTIRRSKLDCAEDCAKNDQCFSMAFQRSSKLCRQFPLLFSRGFVNVSDEDHDEKYYWQYGDGCPPGSDYVLIGDGTTCLGVKSDRLTFYNASEACQREGGHLLIIRDRVHMAIILDHLNTTGTMNNYYVGFTDVDGNGNYRWLDGSSIDRSLWKVGRPTNYPGQVCGVASFRDPISSPETGLNDLTCDINRKYICQLPAL